MTLPKFTAISFTISAAAICLVLTSCVGQPSNVLSTTPDPTTANSGVTAGTVERTAENTGAGM